MALIVLLVLFIEKTPKANSLEFLLHVVLEEHQQYTKAITELYV